jgi:hypothetical protein
LCIHGVESRRTPRGVGETVRRGVLFLTLAVGLPLTFVYGFAGSGQAGPRSQLVSSWVDSDGVAHLNFDVRGVRTGAVLRAELSLHRQTDAPVTGVRIAAASGVWSEAVGWPQPTESTASVHPAADVTSDVVNVNVSSVVRGNGPIGFAVSSVASASAPDVVLSPTAGDEAPSLLVKASAVGAGSSGSESAAAANGSSNVSAGSSAGSRTPVTAGSSPASSTTSQGAPTWQSLWVPLVPPPPGSTSGAWVPAPGPAGCTVSPILVPSCGAWWGVGAVPVAGQTWDQAMVDFDSQQGRSSNLLHYYHVGSATFPTALEISRSHDNGQNRVLLENWKPELGRSWAQVAAGDPVVDAEIDHEASYLQSNYTSPFFLAIHHEPENEVIPTNGSGFTASDYAAMYRHVVNRLRADGVRNAVFVVDYMGAPKWGEQSWFNDLYPGDDVVDWIAEDPYSVGSGGVWRSDFAGTVNRTDGSSWPGFYTWATTAHPGKPIMLAEWGVTEDLSNPAAKATFFTTMAAQSQQFPDIKAFVYWSAPGSRPATATLIDSDPAALSAFRLLAASAQFQVPGR